MNSSWSLMELMDLPQILMYIYVTLSVDFWAIKRWWKGWCDDYYY